MNVTPYLNFSGSCRQAFALYKEVLGGELFQITYGEAPPQPEGVTSEGCAGGMPEGADDLIMHVALMHGQAPFLMGSDIPPNMPQPGSGGVSVALACDDNAEAERVFKALSDGAQIQMPLAETFWAERFGMLVDRYGTPWLINGVQKKL